MYVHDSRAQRIPGAGPSRAAQARPAAEVLLSQLLSGDGWARPSPPRTVPLGPRAPTVEDGCRAPACSPASPSPLAPPAPPAPAPQARPPEAALLAVMVELPARDDLAARLARAVRDLATPEDGGPGPSPWRLLELHDDLLPHLLPRAGARLPVGAVADLVAVTLYHVAEGDPAAPGSLASRLLPRVMAALVAHPAARAAAWRRCRATVAALAGDGA